MGEPELKGNYIYKRGGKYIYRRRIPNYISHLDFRKEVKISLKTEDYIEAVNRAKIYNEQIELFWKELLESGKPNSSNKKYKASVRLARSYGFTYKTTEQVASSSLNEIIKRLSVDIKTPQQVEAVLGGTEENCLKLSDCIELYWDLVNDRLFNKSEHQIRKWKNPRKAAMKNFIVVVSDKNIFEITRKDILLFKKWWNDKIKEGLSADSANKQLRYVKDILQTVSNNNEINIDFDTLFVKTRFQYIPKSRPPFEVTFVENQLLKKLDNLNARDQYVILAIADTGARVSEIFGLLQEDIKLDEITPYIWIRPREGYSLKTRTSERKIPLVGSSLVAFQKFPNGFNDIGNPELFSNIANSYLTTHHLRPTPQHSIYSLRHTFKDRLLDAEAPEEVIDDLMGHKKSGPKYGRGHRLETKLKWLKKIAYKIN